MNGCHRIRLINSTIHTYMVGGNATAHSATGVYQEPNQQNNTDTAEATTVHSHRNIGPITIAVPMENGVANSNSGPTNEFYNRQINKIHA